MFIVALQRYTAVNTSYIHCSHSHYADVTNMHHSDFQRITHTNLKINMYWNLG